MQGEPTTKEAEARSQDVGDLFDGRTTLYALGVILGGNVAMTAVIVGLAYAIEALLLLF
jgi:hypothetical protein